MSTVRATKTYAVEIEAYDSVVSKLGDLAKAHPEVASPETLLDQIVSAVEGGDLSGTLWLLSDGVPAELWWTDERFANARMLVEARWECTSTALQLRD